MLEVGYSEILVIAIVLIVVVGPKDLPKMLRAFGKAMTRFRQVSSDFRRQFDDALREAELDEVRKTIADVRKLDPRQQVRDVFNPLRSAADSIRNDVQSAVKPPIKSNPNPAPQPVEAALASVPDPVSKEKPAVKSPAEGATKKPKPVTAKPALNAASKAEAEPKSAKPRTSKAPAKAAKAPVKSAKAGPAGKAKS